MTAPMPDDAPFHAGEVAMQERAGVRERLLEIGPRAIREHMPQQHREFFRRLPTLLVGSLDAQQRPWASILVGQPGFISDPDERRLRVAAMPGCGDPLREHLCVGAALGMLGIEPQTRRRNRVNGHVIEMRPDGFELRVDQSFGNCPQYIQAREPQWLMNDAGASANPLRPSQREGALLGAAAQALVRRCDTLFIASAAAGGVDVSHRGGKPGFVRVDDRPAGSVLTVPDFRGNFFFNTLGNIAAHPHAGLLFVDYASGDVLQLSGAAEIVWDGAELRSFAGAQRLVRIRVECGVWLPQALPLRWSAPEPAPQLASTGAWGG